MIGAVILAAGAGERLGLPKALARVGARTLVEIVADTCARSLADEIIVVTGARAADVAEALETVRAAHPAVAIRCVENASWASGRTGSLQAAWRTLPAGASVLVFPVDHPAVRLVTLDAMFGVSGYAAGRADVVVPVITRDGRRHRGHPILLSGRLRDEVLALGPDQPLHDVVHAREPLEIPVDDPGILLDVDEPADLEQAARLLGG